MRRPSDRSIRVPFLLLLSLLTACAAPSRSAHLVPDTAHAFLAEVVPAEEGTLFRGTLSPEGDEFWFFRKVTPGAEDYRIYRTRRVDGAWTLPTLEPLGDSTASSMYPVLSPDGRLLIFSTYRPAGGDSGNANLWAARREGDGWGPPFPLAGASTPANYDASPWFGPGEELRFSSTSPDWRETSPRLARPTRDGYGGWEPDPVLDDLPLPRTTHHVWSGILNRTGTLAVVELSERRADGTLGDADLWLLRHDASGWSAPVRLGQGVNTPGTENFATFADDSTLVFVRDFSRFLRVRLR